MPFDEEDLDPHGECAAEIKKLRAEIEALRAALLVAEEWMPAPWTAYTPEAKAQAEQVYKALGWSVDQQSPTPEAKT